MQTFPKIDTLAISSLKCSKSCYKENKDRTKHIIKMYQFERVVYNHKGKKKETEAGGQNDNSQCIGSLAERKVEQIPCS